MVRTSQMIRPEEMVVSPQDSVTVMDLDRTGDYSAVHTCSTGGKKICTTWDNNWKETRYQCKLLIDFFYKLYQGVKVHSRTSLHEWSTAQYYACPRWSSQVFLQNSENSFLTLSIHAYLDILLCSVTLGCQKSLVLESVEKFNTTCHH